MQPVPSAAAGDACITCMLGLLPFERKSQGNSGRAPWSRRALAVDARSGNDAMLAQPATTA